MFEFTQSILLLILFLVPGYVFRTVEGQFVYLDKRLDWNRFALGLVTRSTLVYLPFTAFIVNSWRDQWFLQHPWLSALILPVLFFTVPVACGCITGLFRQKGWIKSIILWLGWNTFDSHQIPTAWDYILSNKEPCWVVVTLKNGEKVRGFLGPESYVSSDHRERDLFVSHVFFQENDTFSIVPGTQGVYISEEEISTIEFIEAHGQTYEHGRLNESKSS